MRLHGGTNVTGSRLLPACGLALATSLSAVSHAAAQVAVQQPVVGRVAVGTTVSVPDRGSILLGSVSSAASSRSLSGPWGMPRGSSIGVERSHSAVSAHVAIHDFAEMDRSLLDQAAGRPTPTRRPAFTTAAELGGSARRTVASSDSARDALPTAASTPAPASLPPRDTLATDRAARAWELGRAAEARGATNVARLHYELAARHGSRLAQERLQQLAANLPDSRVTTAVGATLSNR
jgi:hypothetical protein